MIGAAALAVVAYRGSLAMIVTHRRRVAAAHHAENTDL
jgi:hypothetical protein